LVLVELVVITMAADQALFELFGVLVDHSQRQILAICKEKSWQ
jgi:hypothetical protein